MTFWNKPAVASGISSFSEVVEKACEKLMDQQIKHSIRRIQRMEERLADLEKELDIFLFARKDG